MGVFIELTLGLFLLVSALLAAALALYKLCMRTKNSECDSLNPGIVVYPSYQGSIPQFL